MNENGKVRVGVAAVDPLRSLGLKAILQDTLQMEVVDLDVHNASVDNSLRVVLIDGISETGELLDNLFRLRRQQADVKVIVVSPLLQPEQVQALIGAGAKGYLAHTASESELRMAMEVVLDGSIWAPRKVLARLIDSAGTPVPDAHGTKSGGKLADLITPRERDVLQLLTEGCSNREIAEALKIDEVTVKAHLGRLLRKAGASNRVELTLRALEEGGSGIHRRMVSTLS